MRLMTYVALAFSTIHTRCTDGLKSIHLALLVVVVAVAVVLGILYHCFTLLDCVPDVTRNSCLPVRKVSRKYPSHNVGHGLGLFC